jgi:hypothetical protein
MDKRQFPRFATRFFASLDVSEVPQGEGQVINLSRGGCCVATTVAAKPGTIFQLRMRVPDGEPPIRVDQAIVQWHLTTYLGMKFLVVSEAEGARLTRLLGRLEQESAPIQ